MVMYFKDIQNFEAIRCEAKVSVDKLTALHYAANEIIFHYNMQPAFPRNVEEAVRRLTEVFVQIKELEVKESAKAKQQEILTKGREIVKSLNAYKKAFQYDASCVAAVESMCKYQLSKYLGRKNALTFREGIEILEDNQMLHDIIGDVESNLNTKPNTKAFDRMQGEIIGMLFKNLQTYSFK